MAAHSNILAWKIPYREEPVRLQSMWSERVGHDRAIEQARCPRVSQCYMSFSLEILPILC